MSSFVPYGSLPDEPDLETRVIGLSRRLSAPCIGDRPFATCLSARPPGGRARGLRDRPASGTGSIPGPGRRMLARRRLPTAARARRGRRAAVGHAGGHRGGAPEGATETGSGNRTIDLLLSTAHRGRKRSVGSIPGRSPAWGRTAAAIRATHAADIVSAPVPLVCAARPSRESRCVPIRRSRRRDAPNHRWPGAQVSVSMIFIGLGPAPVVGPSSTVGGALNPVSGHRSSWHKVCHGTGDSDLDLELLEAAVEGAAADAEQAGGLGLVVGGPLEGVENGPRLG